MSNAREAKEIYPCSLCYYALDACSELLIVNQKSKNPNDDLGFESNLDLHQNSKIKEVDVDDFKDKNLHEWSDRVYDSCHRERNTSYPSTLGTSSTRSRVSSYSSMTPSPVEDEIATSYVQHEYGNLHERGNKDSMNCNGIDHDDRTKDTNKDVCDTTPGVPVMNPLSQVKGEAPISALNVTNYSNINYSNTEPLITSTELSLSNSIIPNANREINSDNADENTTTGLKHPLIGIGTDIPEDNDCEIFDQYMREIYATNIDGSSENELEEISGGFSTDLIKLSDREINLHNRPLLNNDVGSKHLNAFDLSHQKDGCKGDKYGCARELFPLSLQSLWDKSEEENNDDRAQSVTVKSENIFSSKEVPEYVKDSDNMKKDECVCESATKDATKRSNSEDTGSITLDVTTAPNEQLNVNQNHQRPTFQTIGTNTEEDHAFKETGTTGHCSGCKQTLEKKTISSKATLCCVETNSQACQTIILMKQILPKHKESKPFVTNHDNVGAPSASAQTEAM